MPTTVRHHDAETLKLKGRSWIGWQTLVWTGLGALLLYGLGLGNHTLWDYHEPYVGGIVREMASSGDFVVPTLNGQPYLEKPPLFYAFAALICRAFGTFEPWALRLPSALLAMATTVWMSFLGWRLSSARAGAWAGFMLSSSVLFFTTGHEAVVDMTLTAAVSFGFGMAFLVIVEPPYRRRWTPWFWVSLGLAFLAKGAVGPFMILIPVALTLLLQRDTRLLRAFTALNWGMLAALLIAASWVFALYHRGGMEFLFEVFVRNTLGRFSQNPDWVPMTGRLGEHVEPFTFYLQRTPGNLLPWLAICVAALWSAVPKHRRHHLSPRTYFLPLAFGVNLLLLSLSEAKRMVYLLPAIPVIFLHSALWLDQRVPRAKRRVDATLLLILALTFVLVGLLAIGFPLYLASQIQMPKAAAWLVALSASFATLVIARLLWQREFPRALDVGMLQWTAFLALFLFFAVPGLDRSAWRNLIEPYQVAARLEQRGWSVMGSQLSETQLGHASLTFRHVIPMLQDPKALDMALKNPSPIVVLVEPNAWRAYKANSSTLGFEIATGATTSRQWDRAPVVVVNRLP
jgi:4-amino-4-deoxy-L-arabinose transferase-like glycosyltransferase